MYSECNHLQFAVVTSTKSFWMRIVVLFDLIHFREKYKHWGVYCAGKIPILYTSIRVGFKYFTGRKQITRQGRIINFKIIVARVWKIIQLCICAEGRFKNLGTSYFPGGQQITDDRPTLLSILNNRPSELIKPFYVIIFHLKNDFKNTTNNTFCKYLIKIIFF